MSDSFDDPLDDEDMIDPVERKTLELLAFSAQLLQQAVQEMQALARQNQQIIQLLGAERETVAIGRDGRQMKARSRLIDG